MKKYLLQLILILFLFSHNLFAGDLSISASVDRNAVAVDDQLSLEINVSGNASGVPEPKIPDIPFTITSSGRSQNISIINGKMFSSVTFHYTLIPKNTGKFTIPSVSLQHEGKTVQTEPINIEVLPSGKAPAQTFSQQPRSGGSRPDSGADSRNQKNIFVTATLDKQTAYVNEQVVYTFRFYNRLRLLSNPQYQAPNFSGFWAEDVPAKNYTTTLNGLQYSVSEIKAVLFPTKPGKFQIGNAVVQCQVEDTASSGDDFFGSFFSSAKPLTVQSNPMSINVIALPEEGKPANFNGAVGQFKISAEFDKRETKENEAVTLILTVTGTGSLKTLTEPVLPDWPDFRKYETVSSVNINKDDTTVKGSKIFKTVIIPLSQGRKTIQPISFSFFDPVSKKYRTENSNSLILDVKPGVPGSAPLAASTSAQTPAATINSSIKLVNKDINYIKNINSKDDWNGYLFNKTWFIILNIIPLLILGFVFIYIKWNEKLSSDVAFARRLKASGTAKKYLKQAKKLLKKDSSLNFYSAISRSILEYIANKLNVSADGLTFASINGLLSSKNVNADDISKIKELLEECDLVRFAPTQVTEEMMTKTYEHAVEIIERMEKQINR